MSQIKVNDYAQTLFDLTYHESAATRDSNFDAFLQELYRRRNLKLLPSIFNAYQALIDRESDSLEAQVIYDQYIPDSSQLTQIRNFLQKEMMVNQVNLTLINQKIGSGLLILANGHRYNLTLDQQILNFKQKLLAS